MYKMSHNEMVMGTDSDFENKENSVLNGNVCPRTPCTEKGYEEMDVSEFNIKLRYSVTPTALPMSRSYTNCNTNKNIESIYEESNVNNKSEKSLPLQPIPADKFFDNTQNSSMSRSLDLDITVLRGDAELTVSSSNNNLNTPRSAFSVFATPDAITPTKELSKTDEASSIVKGLKTVLNLFRASQSPVLSPENEDISNHILSSVDYGNNMNPNKKQFLSCLASTPIVAQNDKFVEEDTGEAMQVISPYQSGKESTKRNSPYKESVVFNEDLEKELNWKDETTIFFKGEKIPIHKLFYPPLTNTDKNNIKKQSDVCVDNMDYTSSDTLGFDNQQLEQHLTSSASDGKPHNPAMVTNHISDLEQASQNDFNNGCEIIPDKEDNLKPNEIVVDNFDKSSVNIMNNNELQEINENKSALNSSDKNMYNPESNSVLFEKQSVSPSVVDVALNTIEIEDISSLGKTVSIPETIVCEIPNQHVVEDIKEETKEIKDLSNETNYPFSKTKEVLENESHNKDTGNYITSESNDPLEEKKMNVEKIQEKLCVNDSVHKEIYNTIISETPKSEILSENKEKVQDNIDEQITLPDSNSPSILINQENFQEKLNLNECINPFASKTKLADSPPLSPKLSSMGLNFNFDKAGVNLYESASHRNDHNSVENGFVSETNITCVTCTSKTSNDKDATSRDLDFHTEDEDTVEGPFLGTEDPKKDKFSDFCWPDDNMIQFSELPMQTNEEPFKGGMFIDAEAFDFLLNQTKSNVVTQCGKESLFLKFDPLFAKTVSTDGILAALSQVQKEGNTPKKVAVTQQIDTTFYKPVPGPSTQNVTQKLNTTELVEESTEDFNVMVSKPMMVVTPAVNSIVTARNKSMTLTSSNKQSSTFSFPAIAVVDRLLSISPDNSLFGRDNHLVRISREQSEVDHAISQLRVLLTEKEIQVCNLRSESEELKDRFSTLESQIRALKSDGENRLKKINDLNEQLCVKTKINKSMAAVVEEYEKTIASLIAESEQDKKRYHEERMMLVKERDEQMAHLVSMELSFIDLQSKYEKSKQIILAYKANEDACKKSIKEFEENLSKMQSNYELLKQHATSKLNHANEELEKMNKAHDAKVLKLNAMIKRQELHVTSLEETLAQKTKANKELTEICDEIINRVG